MQRTFYPVGQGEFYSESFKTGNNNFNVVYDCGSLSRGVDKVISNSFDKNEDINQSYIENAINSMIPLSQTMEEQIKGIREWAKIRAKKAGSIEWETENVAVRQLEI